MTADYYGWVQVSGPCSVLYNHATLISGVNSVSVGDNVCKILQNILTNSIYPKILCIEFCEFTKLDNTSIQMDAEDYFEKLKTFCKIIDMLSFNGYKLLDDSRKGKMTFVSKFC